MVQQANVVQEGVEQLRTAVRRVDRQFKRLQRQVETRRRQLEKEVVVRRKAIEKRAERELKRWQRQLQKQPLYQRAETLRSDATSRFQSGVASFLDALPIATKSEVARLDRKLASIHKKLRDLEKSQGVESA